MQEMQLNFSKNNDAILKNVYGKINTGRPSVKKVPRKQCDSFFKRITESTTTEDFQVQPC